MAKEENQEPTESGSGLGGLGLGAALIGAGALGSAAFGGGKKAFKPKAGSKEEEMAPGKQALLAFFLDMLLSRMAQTGGVNPSFQQYLQGGMPRMPMPDPGAIEALRNQIRQPGAFTTRTVENPAAPSTFQDVASAATTAALLGKLLGGDGGGGGLGGLGGIASASKSGLDTLLGLFGGGGAGAASSGLGGGGAVSGAPTGGAGLNAELFSLLDGGQSGANAGNFSLLGGSQGGAPASGGFRFR